jgi:predicted metal-dependent HD superfamily phosphohydrolase
MKNSMESSNYLTVQGIKDTTWKEHIRPGSLLTEKLLLAPIIQESLTLLDKLPVDLYYHNKQHTIDVIKIAIKCAELDGLCNRDIELIAIAAAWHDTGYLIRRQNNEYVGSTLARAAMLRSKNYERCEIADVVTAIRDTEVTMNAGSASMIQTARGRISPWLLDADLANFASPNYLQISFNLFREFSGIEIRKATDLRDEKALSFLASSMRMMCHHTYLTDGGKILLQPQKDVTIKVLADLMAQAMGGTNESLRNTWNKLIGQLNGKIR